MRSEASRGWGWRQPHDSGKPGRRSPPEPERLLVRYCTSLQNPHRVREPPRAGERACKRSRGISVRPCPVLCCIRSVVKRVNVPSQPAGLCHGLCHNPAIPAGIEPLPAVSLRHTQKAANMPETRMNTASLSRFVSLGSLPYQATRRFDTEEVAGSNPVVPTIFIKHLAAPLPWCLAANWQQISKPSSKKVLICSHFSFLKRLSAFPISIRFWLQASRQPESPTAAPQKLALPCSVETGRLPPPRLHLYRFSAPCGLS